MGAGGQDRTWSNVGWQGGGLEVGAHWGLEIWGRERLRSRQDRKGDYRATGAEVREEVSLIPTSLAGGTEDGMVPDIMIQEMGRWQCLQ